jgi:hypothetical protein
MAFNAVYGPVGALLQAQGRFGIQFAWWSTVAVIFMGTAVAGASIAQGIGVAIGLATISALLSPVSCYLAVRPGGVGWGTVLSLPRFPLVACGLIFGPMILLDRMTPVSPVRDAVALLVVTAVGTLLVGAAMKLLQPALWSEVTERLVALSRRGAKAA